MAQPAAPSPTLRQTIMAYIRRVLLRCPCCGSRGFQVARVCGQPEIACSACGHRWWLKRGSL